MVHFRLTPVYEIVTDPRAVSMSIVTDDKRGPVRNMSSTHDSLSLMSSCRLSRNVVLIVFP